MKRKLRYLILLALLPMAHITVGQVTDTSAQWTWVGGSDVVNAAGVYGTQGVSAPGNIPGARTNSMFWTDTSGNFWLFGGDGLDGYGNPTNRLNDLWLYDRTANQWIWKKGSDTSGKNGIYGTLRVAAANNRPGGRSHAITWTDKSGKLWLFGGSGYEATGSVAANLNDLWRYDPVTNEWTWMSGATASGQRGNYGTQGVSADTTVPGARNSPTGWTDAAGNLWLFGGNGFGVTTTAGNMNDLWMYNISTNQWVWVNGLNGINQFANFSGGTPGSRQGAVAWPDGTGNIYMFGGTGFVQSGGANRLGDLWKYNPVANTWSFIKGATTTNAIGVYGTHGVPDAGNRPGSRAVATVWTDVNGKFWLFGGLGIGSSSGDGRLCDLWMFDPVTDNWTWMKGLQTRAQTGIYGAKGTPAPDNRPGGRGAMAAWKDNDGNFWAFGGIGIASASTDGRNNDLWRLAPSAVSCPLPTPVVSASGVTDFCQGDSVILRGAVSGNGISYRWLEGNNLLPGQTDDSLVVYASGAYAIEISDGSCADTSVIMTVTVYTRPNATLTASGPVSFCDGDSVTLSAGPTGGGYNYEWLKNGAAAGSSADIYKAGSSGSYRVVVTNSNNCRDSSAVTVVTVYPLPVASISLSGPAAFCDGDSVILDAGQGSGWSFAWKRDSAPVGGNTAAYSVTLPGNYHVTVTDGNSCSDSTSADVTVYGRPSLTVTPSDTAFCQGGSVTLQSATADTGLSYQWKDDNGIISNATAHFLQITQSGHYYVVAGSLHAGNCMDSSGIATVTVHPLPEPTIGWDGSELHTESYYSTYQWYIDGQMVPGATDSVWRAVKGSYVVEVTDSNGCSSMSDPFRVTHTGIADVRAAGQVKLYPNPVGEGVLYVNAPFPVHVILSSMDGRVLMQKEQPHTVDMSCLPRGMYLIRITDTNGYSVSNEKIIKQ